MKWITHIYKCFQARESLDSRACPPVETSLFEHYTRAVERLSVEQLETMTRKPYPRSQWVTRVLDEIKAVGSWRGGERAMRMVLRVAPDLNPADVEVIAEAFVRNSQINEAADMPQLIQLMIEATADILGARDIWQRALDAYAQSYQPERDPGGYYNYSEARDSLSR